MDILLQFKYIVLHLGLIIFLSLFINDCHSADGKSISPWHSCVFLSIKYDPHPAALQVTCLRFNRWSCTATLANEEDRLSKCCSGTFMGTPRPVCTWPRTATVYRAWETMERQRHWSPYPGLIVTAGSHCRVTRAAHRKSISSLFNWVKREIHCLQQHIIC